MLLSRFWYVFLAVTAAAATAAALLAQGIINDHASATIEDQLRRDRIELEAVMRLEARTRLDRIAFITVDNKLGGLLKQAAGCKRRALAEAERRSQGCVARARRALGGSRR